MKVTALKPGYFGKLRSPGDVFEVPDGARASWFAPVNAGAEAAKPEAPRKKVAGTGSV